MNIASIFILVLVLAALAFALRSHFRGGHRGGGCCGKPGGCSRNCPGCKGRQAS